MNWGGGFGGNTARARGRVVEDAGPRSQSDWTLIKRLVKYFRDRKKEVAYMTISVIVFTITGVVGPILTGYAIDDYIFPNGVARKRRLRTARSWSWPTP